MLSSRQGAGAKRKVKYTRGVVTQDDQVAARPKK